MVDLKLTPLAGFCAMLYAAANFDGNSCDNELENLDPVLNDEQILKQGYDFWESTDNIQIVKEMDCLLTPAQKLCLLAIYA